MTIENRYHKWADAFISGGPRHPKDVGSVLLQNLLDPNPATVPETMRRVAQTAANRRAFVARSERIGLRPTGMLVDLVVTMPGATIASCTMWAYVLRSVQIRGSKGLKADVALLWEMVKDRGLHTASAYEGHLVAQRGKEGKNLLDELDAFFKEATAVSA